MLIAAEWKFIFWIFIVISERIQIDGTLPTVPPATCYNCRIGKQCESFKIVTLFLPLDSCKTVCSVNQECLSIEYQIGANSCSLYACLEPSTKDGEGYAVIQIRKVPDPKLQTTWKQTHPSTKRKSKPTTAAQVVTQKRTTVMSNETGSKTTSGDASETNYKLPSSSPTRIWKNTVNLTYPDKEITLSVGSSTLLYTYTKRSATDQITTLITTHEANVKQSLSVATTTLGTSRTTAVTATSAKLSTDKRIVKTTSFPSSSTRYPLVIPGTNKVLAPLSASVSAGNFETSTAVTHSATSIDHSVSPAAFEGANLLSSFFVDPANIAAISTTSVVLVVLMAILAAYFGVCHRVKHCLNPPRSSKVSPMESRINSS